MAFDKALKTHVLALGIFPTQIHNEIKKEKGELSENTSYETIPIYTTSSSEPVEILRSVRKNYNIFWKAFYGDFKMSDILSEELYEREIYNPEIIFSFPNLSEFLREEMISGGGTFYIVKIPSPLFMNEELPPYINQKEYIERGEWRWFKDYTKKPKIHIPHLY
jgi:hypothetical protein